MNIVYSVNCSIFPCSLWHDGKNCLDFRNEQGGRSCAGARRPPPKSWDSDENFKPEHTLFCPELRFVAIYALFGDLFAKEVHFRVKNSASVARSALLHCILHILLS